MRKWIRKGREARFKNDLLGSLRADVEASLSSIRMAYRTALSGIGFTYYLCAKWLHRLPSEVELSEADLHMLYLIDLYEGRKDTLCPRCRDELLERTERTCWFCGQPFVGDTPSVEAEDFGELLELDSATEISEDRLKALKEKFSLDVPGGQLGSSE